MAIRHAKVSGLTNPADPDLVGGEDWDDPHVIDGPALVGVALLRLTSGGAILSQNSAGFASTFSKTGTGTYRVDYDPADYGSSYPMIVAGISKDSGAPAFVRWTLENDGVDYIKLVTIDATGAAVDVATANLSLLAGAYLV
jgi:hypothetical protein